jgi:hypothetical protein
MVAVLDKILKKYKFINTSKELEKIDPNHKININRLVGLVLVNIFVHKTMYMLPLKISIAKSYIYINVCIIQIEKNIKIWIFQHI